jgi:hypothetical protein
MQRESLFVVFWCVVATGRTYEAQELSVQWVFIALFSGAACVAYQSGTLAITVAARLL